MRDSPGVIPIGFSQSVSSLPTLGGVYTWTGVRSRGRVWKKLDRLLFNSTWLDRFPNCAVELLNRATSDHCPLLMSCSSQALMSKAFRFQNMWLRRPDFLSYSFFDLLDLKRNC